MAGDWIKVRTTLKDDPRVMAMADMLGVDDAHMVGVLVTFWSWADSHTEDGLVRNLSASRADKIGTLSGFASALESVGWAKIDSESGTIELVNFAEHNGNTAKRRASEAKRKASNRNIPNESRNVSASNADKSRTKTGQNAELEVSGHPILEKWTEVLEICPSSHDRRITHAEPLQHLCVIYASDQR